MMPVELDHVCFYVSRGAPEADCLAALGLTEGRPNQHPGQGTACRRFFFANAYLELLWVENPEEAQSEVARPLWLWERWSRRGAEACPFGVVLRPARQGAQVPPFPAREHRPPYLPQPLALHVGLNAAQVEEPLLLYFPLWRRPDSLPAQNRQPLEHGAGLRELTALRIFGPWPTPLSPAMQAAGDTGAIAFRQSREHFAEIGLDGERQGRRADLRPALSLVICW